MAKYKKNKSNNTFWYALGGLLVVIAAIVFISGSAKADVDYSLYTYTDDQIEVTEAANEIETFEDFQCPACAAVQPILQRIKAEHDVSFTYKHFPLNQIHPYAQMAAEASECARDQNRFWAYHDVLFANQNYLAENHLVDHAEGLGLDVASFEQCLETRATQVRVAANIQEGNSRGVDATPTIFVNGQKIERNSYDAIVAALN